MEKDPEAPGGNKPRGEERPRLDTFMGTGEKTYQGGKNHPRLSRM